MEICDGSVLERPDLPTTHEEADVKNLQQVIHLTNSDKNNIPVLLLHYYNKKHLTCNLLMIGTNVLI